MQFVPLTAAGLEALLTAGPAAVQAAARPDLAPGSAGEWRYGTGALACPPADVVTPADLDRWLGRAGPAAPLVLLATATATGLRRVCHVPADLAWFVGHFPGHPVLPGAVQIRWWIAWLAELAGSAVTVTALGQLKFRAPIGPGAVVEATVDVDVDAGADVATCRFRSAQGPHSEVRLHFRRG